MSFHQYINVLFKSYRGYKLPYTLTSMNAERKQVRKIYFF